MVTASSSLFYLLSALLLIFTHIVYIYTSSNSLQKFFSESLLVQSGPQVITTIRLFAKKYSCLDKAKSEVKISFVLKVEEDSGLGQYPEDNHLFYLP